MTRLAAFIKGLSHPNNTEAWLDFEEREDVTEAEAEWFENGQRLTDRIVRPRLRVDKWEFWLTPFSWSKPMREDCPCCIWNFYVGPFGIEHKIERI